MNLFFTLLTSATAMLICYQDFKTRWIHVIALVAFAISLIITRVHTFPIVMSVAAANVLFLVFLTGTLYTYLLIKKRGRVRLLNRYIGSGDLWIMGILCLGHNLYNYVLVLLSGCTGGLIYWMIQIAQGKKSIRIPLAGCLMIAHTIVIIGYFIAGQDPLTIPLLHLIVLHQ